MKQRRTKTEQVRKNSMLIGRCDTTRRNDHQHFAFGLWTLALLLAPFLFKALVDKHVVVTLFFQGNMMPTQQTGSK